MQNSEIHSIQAAIMRQLSAADGSRFAELNVDSVPSDQFSYHLRQLIKLGFIEKTPDNTYRLSGRGKSRGHLLYANKDGFIEQGFIAVRIVLTKVAQGETLFLMQRRNLVPYKNTYTTPGNKIFFGEDVTDAAVRAMKEQTGLTCDMQLKGIRHLKDEYQGVCVQDKYFFIFAASNPQGELIKTSRTGENLWITYEGLKSSGRSIHGGVELLDIAQQNQMSFTENTYNVDAY